MQILDSMEATGTKIRSALAMVSLIENGAAAISHQDLMEGLSILRERLEQAGDRLEVAYAQAANTKPGHAPASETGAGPCVVSILAAPAASRQPL